MSKPEIEKTIGGFSFTWQAEAVCIKVGRLRVHQSDGRVTGEVRVFNIVGEELQKLYPPTSLNFTSEPTRSKIANSLAKIDEERHWALIINQLSDYVTEKAREGEPVEELWTSQGIKPPEFVLYPLLYKKLPTIIYGEKAVCKSTIAIAVASCLTLGWSDNPLGWEVPDQSINALILNWEVDGYISQWYADKFQKGMKLPDFPIYHRRCKMPLVDDIEEIKDHVDRVGAQVLIIDSLGAAVGDNLSDPACALRFNTALSSLDCSSMIIGQTSKDQHGRKSVFGSVYFEYYARNIWEIKKVQQEGEQEIDIALYNTYHNLGATFRPMGYHVSFKGGVTQIMPTEITARELVQRLSTEAQIRKALRNTTMTAPDLVAHLEGNKNTIYSTLRRMVAAGKVVQLQDRSYGLMTEEA